MLVDLMGFWFISNFPRCHVKESKHLLAGNLKLLNWVFQRSVLLVISSQKSTTFLVTASSNAF